MKIIHAHFVGLKNGSYLSRIHNALIKFDKKRRNLTKK